MWQGELFPWIKADARLKDVSWHLVDRLSARYEYDDGPCDRQGRPLAAGS